MAFQKVEFEFPDEEQELQIDAQKAGAKLAADRRKDSTKLDLALLKTVQNTRKDT